MVEQVAFSRVQQQVSVRNTIHITSVTPTIRPPYHSSVVERASHLATILPPPLAHH